MKYTNNLWAAKAAATLLGIAISMSPSWAPAQEASVQTVAATSTAPSAAQAPGVPRLVRFTGTLKDNTGKVPARNVELKISFYGEDRGGQALWSEMQTVRANSQGQYTVLLGASEPDGLPTELFSANQARWVGIEPMLPGIGESPRVLLVGVPYALKAADSETLGGKPASDYVTLDALNGLVAQSSVEVEGAQQSVTTQPVIPPVNGTGITNYIPIWTNSTTLGDSTLFELNGKVGIGKTAPNATLDVNGSATVRGPLHLSARGSANINTGFASNPQDWFASSFNSTTHVAVDQDFRWQAEPTGNNSGSPSGTLNLLFGANGATPTETGLSLNKFGQITFAPGQSFPSKSVVQSLNGLTGPVVLAPGSNVTITPNGQTLTIAASGLSTVAHDGTLNGLGTTGSPLAIAVPLALNGNSGSAIVAAANANGDGITGNSSAGDGVAGVTSAAGKSGVYGAASSAQGFAVLGRNTADGSIGYLGFPGQGAGGTSASPANGTAGVYGVSQRPAGIGIVDATGVWGDSFAGDGLVGTSNQNNGLVAVTADSLNQFNAGAFLDNKNANRADPVLQTFGESVMGSCTITTGGDLACTGSKSAVVPVDNGSHMVALYAVESPQNWFEDFGSGQLANGSATINLEPVFTQTVNTGVNYHVYLTPNGDCKGLYIAQKGPASFEVRELGSGRSSVGFDYRIVAERKGYESLRLEDKTQLFDMQRLMRVAKGLQHVPSNNATEAPAGNQR